MNGVAFANLPQLVAVDLKLNVCIDKFYATERASNVFRRKVTRNCASSDAARKEISCSASSTCTEDIDRLFIRSYNRTAGCCILEYGTLIDSPDYFFGNNNNYEKLEIMMILRQRNMEFLPVRLNERFPNLKFYWAIDTPVTRIFKKNFEKMQSLTLLSLIRNQIEVIRSDSFEDLINLKQIYISKF